MDEYQIIKYIKEYAVDGVLPMEKQIELFKQYHQDLENGISSENSLAYAILIIANENLIYKYAKMIVQGKVDLSSDSDIYFAGKMGLIYAVQKFDIERNVSFANFAYYCINAEICRHLNKENKDKKIIFSLSDFIKIRNGEQYFDLDIPDDNFIVDEIADKIEYENQRKTIFYCFKYLTESEQKCLVYYYGLLGNRPITLCAIGEMLSISKSRVQGLINRAISKIKLLTTENELTPAEQHTLKMYTRKEYDFIPEIKKFLKENSEELELN